MAQAIGPVRDALNTLGVDASTDAVLAWVKNKYKVDETNARVNQTRANMRQAMKNGATPNTVTAVVAPSEAPKPRVQVSAAQRIEAKPSAVKGHSGAFLANSIKELIEEFGLDEVVSMVDVFKR